MVNRGARAKTSPGCRTPAQKGTSNTLTYLIILGVTLSIIAYSLSAFLQFQLQIKGPVQQSLNATAKSSQEFQAAMSGDWGLSPARTEANATTAGPDSAILSIETFPPYFQATPALFQITITNPTTRMLRIEKTVLEVRHGNATQAPEPGEFGRLEVAYKKTRDSYFTPQEPGNYTLRATLLQNSTPIKAAEKTISVHPPPNSRQTTTFSGTADFSLNTTSHALFRYWLKDRRFLAAGSGKSWHVTIPRNFTYTDLYFPNFTKNADTGIGAQFFEAGGAYFNTMEEGGHDAFLTAENTEFYPNTTADYIALLAASACPASLLLQYENSTETKNLSTGTDICPLGQQCANSRQIGAALQRQACGETSKKYLHASKTRLRNEKLVGIGIRPGCELYLAGITLSTTKTREYKPPSSAHLIVQNTTLIYINNRQHPDYEEIENFNTLFRKIDITDNLLSGEREFNISTDTPLSFTPHLLYTEILEQTTNAPNISGKVQGSKLILTPELESHTQEFSREFSYGSSAGSCYSGSGLWGFGAPLSESPEVSIGSLSVGLTSSFEWPANPPPTVSTTLALPDYESSQTATQADASSGKAIVSLGGYNAPQGGTPLVHNSIAHADTNVNLDYASNAKLKMFFGAVEATDWRYTISGITDKDHAIDLPEDLLGLYLIVKSDVPLIKYPLAAAGFYTKADLLGESYSARGYKMLQNGWNPQGYARMELRDDVVFADLSQKALPKQRISLRTRTETDTPNTLDSNSAEIHLVAVKKKPIRARISAGNQTFYTSMTEQAEIVLENPANITASAEGTGELTGELEVSSIKDTQATISAPIFNKALLILEPSGRTTNLQIIANNQIVRTYPELSNIDKADISQFLVPELHNTIEFKGSGGTLNWKLIFE